MLCHDVFSKACHVEFGGFRQVKDNFEGTGRASEQKLLFIEGQTNVLVLG